MSEAYEIGVTLALGDGVSAGIAQARRDTAQLERVLQAGGVSVQQLRAASVAALAATRAVPVAEKVAGKEPAVVQAEERVPVVREAAARAAVPGRPQGGDAVRPAAVVEAAVAPMVAPRVEAGAAAVPRRVAAPVVVADGPPVVAAPPGQAEQAGRARPAAPAAAAGPPGVLHVSAPVSLAAIGAAAKGEQPVCVGSGSGAVGSGPAAARQAGRVPAAAAEAAVPETRAPAGGGVAGAAPRAWEQAAPQGWMAPGADDGGGVAGAGPLPSAAAPARPSAAPQGNADAAAPAPAAPPAAAANAGPTEGDVFLDGALVGRWISRFLSQEAGRASAGPTGFDPRRGRLLPGATVGG